MNHHNFKNLSAVFVNCTLKKAPEKSHTDTLFQVSKTIMEKEGVSVKNIRFIDHEVATGIQPDMTAHG